MINLSLSLSVIIFSFCALSSCEKIYRFMPTTSILVANRHTLNSTCIMLQTVTMVIFLVISGMVITSNLIFHTEFVYAQKQEQKVSSSADGTLQCSNDLKTYEGKIYFLAIKDNGPIYGTYEIIVSNTTSNGSMDKAGSLIDGNISSGQYRLIGSESQDNICGEDNAFTTVTIAGECGPASSIDVLASGDYNAKFVGNVDCPPPGNTGFPIAKATGPIEIAEGEKAILSGTGSIDPDGDPLLYQWKQIGGAAVNLINPGGVETEFIAPPVGPNDIADFELTVRDNRGNMNTDRLSMLIYGEQPQQQPPLAKATGPIEIAEGEKAILSGTGSIDPDGDPLLYQWKQIGGADVNLINPGGVETEFIAPSTTENSTLTFGLTVDDSRGGIDTSSVNVKLFKRGEIELNQPPLAVADASPRTLSSTLDTEVVLDGTQSSDPDEDSLSYSWEQLGGPSVGLSNSDEVESTFDSDIEVEEDITLTFKLTVDDGRGGIDSDTVGITIKAEDLEPEEPQPPSNGAPGDGDGSPQPEREPEPEPEPDPEPEPE
jgi:hypothetical protein